MQTPWSDRICGWLPLPEKIGSAPFRKKWKGPEVLSNAGNWTSLDEKLCFIHSSGLLAILSGTYIWCAQRLKEKTDPSEIVELSEALFLYQISTHYLKNSRVPYVPDEEDQFSITVNYLAQIFVSSRTVSGGKWALYPTFEIVKEAIKLTRHHFPKPLQIEFDRWVDAMIERVNQVVPFPGQGDLPIYPKDEDKSAQRILVMGRPLPPEILDLSADVRLLDLDAKVAEFESTVDWQTNRFLQAPDDVAQDTRLARVYGTTTR